MSKRRSNPRRARPSTASVSLNGYAPVVASVETVVDEIEIEEHPIVGLKYLRPIRMLLLILLALGLAWRFVGLRWDAGHHLHPDERFLTMVVPELGLPASLSDWFRTASSSFNPFVRHQNCGLFVYGQLPLLIAKLVAVPLQQDSYDGILIVGRALSALFDADTVLLTWLIGRRLLGREGGLLAAILLAFTALNIQLAHFYTVDTFATFFLVLSFWGLLKWLDAGRARWALLAGSAWGLSAACKISTLLFAPIVLLALIFPLATLIFRRRRKAGAEEPRPSLSLADVLFGALAVAAGAFVCFRVGHPMAFRGEAGILGGFFDVRLASGPTINSVNKTFWTSVAEQRDITNGQIDVPWNLQWFGRTNFWWPLRNLLVWGVGWQAMLPAIIALFWLPLRLLRRDGKSLERENPQWLLVAAWALFGFGYNAMQYSKFSRYFLLVTPFFALLAAWFAVQLWQLAQDRHKYLQNPEQGGRRDYLPLGAALAIGAMLGGTVCWGSAVTSIYTVPNTRVAATEFLQSLPEHTRISKETDWDDALPLDGQEHFEMLDLKVIEHEDAAWRTNLLDQLSRAEWVSISSPRMWASLPRLPMRFPLATRYYQALFSGELGLVPEREFASYPQLNLLGWHIDFRDDNTEEALTVYDHPRVVLWQHGASWSRERAEAILDPRLLDQVDNAPLSELIQRGARVDENALPWMPHPAQPEG